MKTIYTEIVIEVPDDFNELEVNSKIEEAINNISDFNVINFGDYSED